MCLAGGIYLFLLFAVFVVNFVEGYRYGEGEGDTFVCVEGRGQLAQPVTASVTSITGGTAAGKTLTQNQVV